MWQLTSRKSWKELEQQFRFVRAMRDVPQDPRCHAEGDVAVHTRMVIKQLLRLPGYRQLSPLDREILWTAALLHDVEKRSTTVIEADGSITSRGHARRGEQTARELLYRYFPAPFHIREQIAKLVRYHDLPLCFFEKPDPLKSLIQASLEVDTHLLALLAEANVRGRISPDRDELLERIAFFRAYCEENKCWGQPYPFSSGLSRFTYFYKEDAFPTYEPFDTTVCEVVLLSGLPGAGKDTYLAQHLPGWPVVSLDDFRRQLRIDPADREGTGYVVQMAKEKAKSLLRQHTSFVWNATTLTRPIRQQLVELFAAYKARVRLVYLEVPYPQLRQQNRNRLHVVPNVAMDRMIARLEVPASWEAHEVVYEVR
ncbi:putative kinase [Larkinella arboricola]|uniref:Putative kinase n=1 Tax=Larkinella arboricola TaxID=643671 RepID=A0A327WY51_LARAB|nr:AAA family ATPase [Larkinella arboricola]RAJ98099.1 putative kinase [Larkinella arboricola]